MTKEFTAWHTEEQKETWEELQQIKAKHGIPTFEAARRNHNLETLYGHYETEEEEINEANPSLAFEEIALTDSKGRAVRKQLCIEQMKLDTRHRFGRG